MHRRNRLGSSSLIRRVHAQGRRARRPLFTLSFLSLGTDEPARFAVVASRRVGAAVERNRARRRLRAALDTSVASVKPGIACVVAATAQTNRVNFQELEDSLRAALSDAGLTTSLATSLAIGKAPARA